VRDGSRPASGRRVRRVRLGLALVALAGLAAACSSAGPASAQPGGSSGALLPLPSVRQVHVSISDAGCAPEQLQLAAGPATFIVTNTGSANVLEYEIDQSDRVLGEVENVIPGIDRTFTLDLKPGTYKLSCPGGTTSATGTLTVTE
jgi:iron uptake system EfeUOB component EfeO/EfeM